MDENKNDENLDNISNLTEEDIKKLFSGIIEFPENVHLADSHKACAKVFMM